MTENETTAVTTKQMGTDIVLITMDLPGSGANILNDQLFAELDKTMAALSERTDLKLSLIHI